MLESKRLPRDIIIPFERKRKSFDKKIFPPVKNFGPWMDVLSHIGPVTISIVGTVLGPIGSISGQIKYIDPHGNVKGKVLFFPSSPVRIKAGKPGDIQTKYVRMRFQTTIQGLGLDLRVGTIGGR